MIEQRKIIILSIIINNKSSNILKLHNLILNALKLLYIIGIGNLNLLTAWHNILCAIYFY